MNRIYGSNTNIFTCNGVDEFWFIRNNQFDGIGIHRSTRVLYGNIIKTLICCFYSNNFKAARSNIGSG